MRSYMLYARRPNYYNIARRNRENSIPGDLDTLCKIKMEDRIGGTGWTQILELVQHIRI